MGLCEALTGKVIALEVEPRGTMENIKAQKDRKGILPSQRCLILWVTSWRMATVKTNNIQKKITPNMVLCLPGRVLLILPSTSSPGNTISTKCSVPSVSLTRTPVLSNVTSHTTNLDPKKKGKYRLRGGILHKPHGRGFSVMVPCS